LQSIIHDGHKARMSGLPAQDNNWSLILVISGKVLATALWRARIWDQE